MSPNNGSAVAALISTISSRSHFCNSKNDVQESMSISSLKLVSIAEAVLSVNSPSATSVSLRWNVSSGG